MGRETLLSVIVPVYNVEAYLVKCVDSILNQTYKNLEVILVNDGSTDTSGSLCDALARKDSRIRVIHKENGGLSSARNAGMDAAAGEYITFVDSDDWIEADAYEHLMGLMQQYRVQLVCGGNFDVDGATGKRTLGVCPKKEELVTAEEFVGKMFLWQGCDSSVCDKIFHRTLLENFRFPEGQVSEDVAITYKIVLGAERAVLSEKPFYNYYHRVGSISRAVEITDKSFHFSRHTAVIYGYIREHHPAIEPQARYLRVKSLAHILLNLEQADADVRTRFAEEYRHARKELKKHTAFLLGCPWLSKQEKVTDLLLNLGLYRTLRPIFHRE